MPNDHYNWRDLPDGRNKGRVYDGRNKGRVYTKHKDHIRRSKTRRFSLFKNPGQPKPPSKVRNYSKYLKYGNKI